MLVNKKTKYFRKALRVIKSTQFSTKGKISKVLQELLSHGIYAKYNTENKTILFAISTDSCELDFIRKKIDPEVLIKFNNDKRLDGVMRKKLNLTLANSYGWKSKMNFSKVLDEIIEDFKNSHI